jgi:AraC-like DNA-binding protein
MNMCENREKLCQSVIDKMKPKSHWLDNVYLSPECKERFLTHSDIPELAQEDIHMAGMAKLKEGYQVERLGIALHTLLFTLEGGGILTTADRVELIDPYTLVVLPAHTSYRFEINPVDNYWKIIWIVSNPTAKWQFCEQLGQRIIPFNLCDQIWSLMDLIHHEIGGRPSFRRLLVSELYRLLTGFETKASRSVARVQAVFNDVESQLHLTWTVKSMARSCYISEEQFNRITKKLFELSPRSKLIQLRMDKAVDLLNYNGWTITMIAHRLGYKDPYNFSHRFRKYYGCSPSQYRKNSQLTKTQTVGDLTR